MTLSHNKNHWNVFWLTTRNLRAVSSSQVTVSLVSTFSFDKSRYIKLCFYLICSTCIRWNQVQMICYFEKQSMFFIEVENSENRILICTKLWSGAKLDHFHVYAKLRRGVWGRLKSPVGPGQGLWILADLTTYWIVFQSPRYTDIRLFFFNLEKQWRNAESSSHLTWS